MKSISLIVLSFVAISTALPQFNQAGNQDLPSQQQGFPTFIGNQNPFLPGNQGFGLSQEFGGQQQQQGFGSLQGFNNNNQQQGTNQNQQQSTTTAPGASPVVGTPQFVLCNQNCPSVNQYNPICGSNQITYNNQYRLDCANDCGRQLDPNWQEITIFSRRNCVSGSRVA